MLQIVKIKFYAIVYYDSSCINIYIYIYIFFFFCVLLFFFTLKIKDNIIENIIF